MKYSFGNIQYYWPQQIVFDFYKNVINSPANIVYLGESVCSKRSELKNQHWLELAKDIQAAGKQPILSTMALLVSKAEILNIRRSIESGNLLVEANDMGAVHVAQELKLPFVAGQALNCYNAQTLLFLEKLGMTRWVVPVEIGFEKLNLILNELPHRTFEVEVMAYGHQALAYSSRCFTARHEGREKDKCERCCLNYPEGLNVNSQEDQQLFKFNGVQTQAGRCLNLRNNLPQLIELADILRINPEKPNCTNLLKEFIARIDTPDKFPPCPLPSNQSNGYWSQIAGIEIV